MKIVIALIIFGFLPSFGSAQHCPFDGANLIVVRVTDKKGKPIKNAKISLREIDNSDSESCSFTKGLVNKPFKPVRIVLDNLYKSSNIANQYCEDCNFLGAGFYAVSLNMSEARCMIKAESGYKSVKRKFKISYGKQKILVDESDIHPLCLNAGKWSRIVPIKLSYQFK